LGAAIDAAVGLKIYPDFQAAVNGMTRTGRVFEPIKANQILYNDLYSKVYLKMYKQLRPLFKDIRDITGYPAKN
jgi:sugar (pentulose or hexulose) kinase